MGVYSLAFQKTKYVATSKLVMNANDDLPGTSGLNYSLNIIPSYQNCGYGTLVLNLLKNHLAKEVAKGIIFEIR